MALFFADAYIWVTPPASDAKGNQAAAPPLTSVAGGVILLIRRQRTIPLPPIEIFTLFYISVYSLHKIRDRPILCIRKFHGARDTFEASAPAESESVTDRICVTQNSKVCAEACAAPCHWTHSHRSGSVFSWHNITTFPVFYFCILLRLSNR